MSQNNPTCIPSLLIGARTRLSLPFGLPDKPGRSRTRADSVGRVGEETSEGDA